MVILMNVKVLRDHARMANGRLWTLNMRSVNYNDM